MNIVEKAKENFGQYLESNEDIFGLDWHVEEVERWALRLTESYPEADVEIVTLGAWLHDIGHYPINKDVDHAVTGEEIARKFLLSNGYPAEKLERVVHIVRAHRCKDVLPQTIEAKIIACADSASHLTDSMYVDIIKEGRSDYALAKLERDYRDVALFPEAHDELKPVYEAWKKLLNALVELD